MSDGHVDVEKPQSNIDPTTSAINSPNNNHASASPLPFHDSRILPAIPTSHHTKPARPTVPMQLPPGMKVTHYHQPGQPFSIPTLGPMSPSDRTHASSSRSSPRTNSSFPFHSHQGLINSPRKLPELQISPTQSQDRLVDLADLALNNSLQSTSPTSPHYGILTQNRPKQGGRVSLPPLSSFDLPPTPRNRAGDIRYWTPPLSAVKERSGNQECDDLNPLPVPAGSADSRSDTETVAGCGRRDSEMSVLSVQSEGCMSSSSTSIEVDPGRTSVSSRGQRARKRMRFGETSTDPSSSSSTSSKPLANIDLGRRGRSDGLRDTAAKWQEGAQSLLRPPRFLAVPAPVPQSMLPDKVTSPIPMSSPAGSTSETPRQTSSYPQPTTPSSTAPHTRSIPSSAAGYHAGYVAVSPPPLSASSSQAQAQQYRYEQPSYQFQQSQLGRHTPRHEDQTYTTGTAPIFRPGTSQSCHPAQSYHSSFQYHHAMIYHTLSTTPSPTKPSPSASEDCYFQDPSYGQYKPRTSLPVTPHSEPQPKSHLSLQPKSFEPQHPGLGSSDAPISGTSEETMDVDDKSNVSRERERGESRSNSRGNKTKIRITAPAIQGRAAEANAASEERQMKKKSVKSEKPEAKGWT